MQSTHAEDLKSDNLQHPFDQVYLAAKNKDEATLKTIKILDVKKGKFTPVGKLAKEGNTEAVLLLIKYGASVHVAAIGATMGGHYLLVDMLYNHGANINFIAQGAAIAGDYEYLNGLFSKYDKDKKGIDRKNVAFGAAQRGDFTYVDQLYELNMPTEQEEKIKFLDLIANAAMMNGHRDYALKICDKCDDEDEKRAIKLAILHGAITRENWNEIEELCSQPSFCDDRFPRHYCLAQFAGYSMSEKECIKLFRDERWSTDKEYRRNVIAGIELGSYVSGNLDLLNLGEAKKYIADNKSDKNEMRENAGILISTLNNYVVEVMMASQFLMAAILCGAINAFINAFEKQGYFSRGITKLYDGLADVSMGCADFRFYIYLYNDSFLFNTARNKMFEHLAKSISTSNLFSTSAIALHQFSFIDDYKFLRAINENDLFEQHIRDVIPEAIKINQLMKKYDFNFEQALSFLKYKELRELLYITIFNTGDMFLPEIFLHVLGCISQLSFMSARDMYNKTSLTLNKSFLSSDIEKYQASFWVNHGERATSFLEASKKTHDRNTLKVLIKYQKDLFDGIVKPEVTADKSAHEQPLNSTDKGAYYKIIEKNVLRLR